MNEAIDIQPPGWWRVSSKATVLLLLLTTALALTASSAHAAEPSKFYNAEHSLTGDCKESKVDPIPDPGCPGGTHPPTAFVRSWKVAVGPKGETYVHSSSTNETGVPSHIDIFDSNGHFITRVKNEELTDNSPNEIGLRGIAVDSTGHLYVAFGTFSPEVVRFDPSVYNPDAGEISYEMPGVLIVGESTKDMAVDLSNDHLFIRRTTGSESYIAEFGPPTDGVPNELLTDEIGRGDLQNIQFGSGQFALDRAHHRIYALDWQGTTNDEHTVIKVFSDESPYQLIETIDGSTLPNGEIVGSWRSSGLAVDEVTGRVFLADDGVNRVYELKAGGEYVATLPKPSLELGDQQIALDGSEESPNKGYLYVGSGALTGHLFAYEPSVSSQPPIVEGLAVAGVGAEEAVLKGTVDPKSEPAHWVIEYVSEQQYTDDGGFVNALVAGEGDVSPGGAVEVSAPATGLVPATAYRFRVRAENQCEPLGCEAETEASFSTFPAPPPTNADCPNQAFRTGASGTLPDCRAYELVTPPDTAGFPPRSVGAGSGTLFATPAASPAGDSVAFAIVGSLIPGFPGGTGHLQGDTYVVRRGLAAWETEILGPDATQATIPRPGGLSADHRFFAVTVSGEGSLTYGEDEVGILGAEYVRYPDGSFHLTGEGSLANTPLARTSFISESGSHLVMLTWSQAPQLEPLAPDGAEVIYDLTADGVLHVVSLLPGDVTPEAGISALMRGASSDGSAIAFSLKNSPELVYVRVDNAKTLPVGAGAAEFAGISDDGRYLLYLEGDDLYRLDTVSEVTEAITAVGDAVPVNIGSEGTGGYFLSSSVLPVGNNPLGASPQAGGQNLYHWGSGGLAFVATVTDRDAEGQSLGNDGFVDGLGLLTGAEELGRAQVVLSSRTSGDGSVLLFESRADITGFDSAGKVEVYRFDATANALQCVSCDPTGVSKPSGDASVSPPIGADQLFSPYVEIPTLTADGARAFFETPERLVAGDNDGLSDVYEWEADGVGSCSQTDGCLFLISTGQSTRDNRIFGVSRSGDDVFILTSDLLAGGDTDATPSIYDARVGGGFAPPPVPPAECLGEACQPAANPPFDATPNSASYHGQGNVAGKKATACSKGKRKVRRGGKSRCVPKRKRHHRHRAHANRRAHR